MKNEWGTFHSHNYWPSFLKSRNHFSIYLVGLNKSQSSIQEAPYYGSTCFRCVLWNILLIFWLRNTLTDIYITRAYSHIWDTNHNYIQNYKIRSIKNIHWDQQILYQWNHINPLIDISNYRGLTTGGKTTYDEHGGTKALLQGKMCGESSRQQPHCTYDITVWQQGATMAAINSTENQK